MAYYTGAMRKAYVEQDGPPIDQVSTRSLADPTVAHLSLLTDIDRLQWGLQTDWGNPPYYASTAVRDGGTSGSSGSYAAVGNRFHLNILVPPRVDECDVLALVSGVVRVELVTSHHAAGVTLGPSSGLDFVPGSDTYDDPSLAYPHSTAGDPLTVAASTHEGDANLLAVTVTVTAADVKPSEAGFGGVLWGLCFFWRTQSATTWDVGDDADALNVNY